MRSTLNIQFTSSADYARQLRSLASKVEAGDLTPGADFKRGNVRVQVHTPQESDIRAWARANADTLAAQGITVGGRGRYSKALTDAYAAHLKAEKAAKAAERKAAREAKLAAV